MRTYQKITSCRKRQKVIWWAVTFGTVSQFLHLLHEKIRCLLHFNIIMSYSAWRAQQCWKQDQKYKTKIKTEAGLRPVLS